MMDYLRWRGDISILHSPPNEVDMALLSMLIVPDLSGMIPSSFNEHVLLQEAAAKYCAKNAGAEPKLGILEAQSSVPMTKLMGDSRRFAETRLSGYVIKIDEGKTEQFGAMTATLADGTKCIVYRPTDDTIVGWKEDFMLAVSDRVKAQDDALAYLTEAAAVDDAPIVTVGHSKGGNLSAYAAIHATADIKKRIRTVYNFDGPGFSQPLSGMEGYQEISDKIVTIRPQHSMIGTLMHEPGRIVTIKSSAGGPTAHDPFKWEVMRTAFIREIKGQSPSSKRFEESMAATLDQMDTEKRKAFIEEFFGILTSGGARTLTDLREVNPQQLIAAGRLIMEDRTVLDFFNTFFEELILTDGMKRIRARRRAINKKKEEAGRKEQPDI